MKTIESLQSEITMLHSTVNALLAHIEDLKKENKNLRTSGIVAVNDSDPGKAAPAIRAKPVAGDALNHIKTAAAETAYANDALKIKDKVGIAATQTLTMSKENISRLGWRVKSNFKTQIKRTSMPTIARELIFLYNNGTATSKEIRAAAGLKQHAFEKHFTMLRQKKIIQKNGVLKYSLTPDSHFLITNLLERLDKEN